MSSISIAESFPDLLRGWRKTRKLSQWNLALDAGVSQRHLSFLESGRSSPSRDMVTLLARSLNLPLREQNALLNAAGFAAIHPERSLDQAEMKQAKHAMSVMLQYHEPYPAIVVDRNWNIIMMNDATVRLFSLFIDPVAVWGQLDSEGPPNIMRVTLHPNGMKPYITNWEEFAAYFTHQITAELGSNPYNHEARALYDELRALPGMPDEDVVPPPVRPCLTLRMQKDDVAVEFFSVISTFGTPLDVTLQEIRIETFFPGDEATDQLLQSLAEPDSD